MYLNVGLLMPRCPLQKLNVPQAHTMCRCHAYFLVILSAYWYPCQCYSTKSNVARWYFHLKTKEMSAIVAATVDSRRPAEGNFNALVPYACSLSNFRTQPPEELTQGSNPEQVARSP